MHDIVAGHRCRKVHCGIGEDIRKHTAFEIPASGTCLEGGDSCREGHTLCKPHSERGHLDQAPQQPNGRQHMEECLDAGRLQASQSPLQAKP